MDRADPTLEEVADWFGRPDKGGWQTWRGGGGILYARRPRSSPPVVLRAATPWGLRDAIRQWGQRGEPPAA